jgi:uncharacterized protein YggE
MFKFKKNLAILFFLTASCSMIYAQTSDRFIKIVGNAKGVYTAEGLSLYLTVNEVQPNSYQQVKYKAIETVYQNLVANITKLGYKETDLKRDLKTAGGGYQNIKMERYVINVANTEEASKIMKSEMEGVVVSEVKYVFKTLGVESEEQLAVDAIKDAERKAKKIAKEIGKKVGKIMNLEDKSSGCCREIEDNKDKTVSKQYKVTVTFELID